RSADDGVPLPSPHHHRPQAQLTRHHASIRYERRGGHRATPARPTDRECAGRVVMTYVVTALDGVAFGLLLFVVAAGLALVFGVMGVLNLAHGSLYLAGAAAAYLFSTGSMAGLAAALAVGAAVGAASGVGLTVAMRPLARFGRLS